MEISVQKVYDKANRRINEDALLIKDNLYAVFDGATSQVPYLNKKGETGAKLASTIAKNEFSDNKGSLKDLAINANNKINEAMIKENIKVKDKLVRWSTNVAAVRLNNAEVEYLVVGDCFILAIFEDNSSKLLVPYHDHDLENMKEWRKLADKKINNIYEKLKPQRTKLRREMNITYGALNGEREAVKFFNYGKTNLRNIRSVIIFTDGLLIPKEDPEGNEDWELFVRIYQKAGLKGLLKYVRDIEKKDPKCWKYPRYKQHDDATAIAIDFS